MESARSHSPALRHGAALTEEAQSFRQLDLLGTDDTRQEKQEAVESAMDALRKKFGRSVISYGTAEGSISGGTKEID